MRNERKIFLIYTNQTGNTVNYGKSFQNVQGIGKIQFFYFIGNNNQFGIAILAGLLNNLGDTYLTCSEYACDIRKNTWSVSYLQTEEETGISILNIFHGKFFVAGADMKIRMFFNDMSCNCT